MYLLFKFCVIIALVFKQAAVACIAQKGVFIICFFVRSILKMNIFTCDGSYKADLKEYSETILEKYGVSAKSSEREIICMSDEGNVVASKLYGDLIYHKKLMRKYAYRDAFDLYLKAAGITVADGKWSCSGKSYPQAFWNIGYFLMNYRRGAFLKECEQIDIIENMGLTDRLAKAFELGIATIIAENNSGAVNMVGRLLKEVSEDDGLFEELHPVIEAGITVLKSKLAEKKLLSENDENISAVKKENERLFCDMVQGIEVPVTKESCSKTAEDFFVEAAQDGYVFACNSLAVKEADRIIELYQDQLSGISFLGDDSGLNECIINYICYLKLAADKFESYAANRLGLFYMTGEVASNGKKAVFKDYIDVALAKEYFVKATVYPDENSAWGYFNLMKYFPKMYEKDIDLMNEHMDYIKNLNPAVYDIAMDL